MLIKPEVDEAEAKIALIFSAKFYILTQFFQKNEIFDQGGQCGRGRGHNCHEAETSNHEAEASILGLEAEAGTGLNIPGNIIRPINWSLIDVARHLSYVKRRNRQ